MNISSAQRKMSSVWFIPSLLMICTALALAVGLFYDGAWDLVASLLLAVPVISFVERCARRQKR
jgi:hypothetical protein